MAQRYNKVNYDAIGSDRQQKNRDIHNRLGTNGRGEGQNAAFFFGHVAEHAYLCATKN